MHHSCQRVLNASYTRTGAGKFCTSFAAFRLLATSDRVDKRVDTVDSYQWRYGIARSRTVGTRPVPLATSRNTMAASGSMLD